MKQSGKRLRIALVVLLVLIGVSVWLFWDDADSSLARRGQIKEDNPSSLAPGPKDKPNAQLKKQDGIALAPC